MQYYDKVVVGNRIKQVRKQQRMTQSKLAECLDYVNERQLQRIENGKTGCSVDKIMEIAQILNTSTDYLLFGSEANESKFFKTILKGKTNNQIRFICIILKTIAENMDLVATDIE